MTIKVYALAGLGYLETSRMQPVNHRSYDIIILEPFLNVYSFLFFIKLHPNFAKKNIFAKLS